MIACKVYQQTGLTECDWKMMQIFFALLWSHGNKILRTVKDQNPVHEIIHHILSSQYSCWMKIAYQHLPSLSMMLTVTGPPTNKAGGATLPARVKFSVPSTRRSSRMLTKVDITLPSLVPRAKVTSVLDRRKSWPTASERKQPTVYFFDQMPRLLFFCCSF